MSDNEFLKELDKMILAAAAQRGIEVIFPKHRIWLKIPGVHLVNPTNDEIMEGITKCLGTDLKYVICYIRPI